MTTVATGRSGCSIQATLDIVGDRWTLLIVRDLFRGVRRFSAMQHDLGIARNMLADRLGRLVDAGIAAKVPYQHRPIRYDYVLTHKGRDLSNSLLALMAWGDRWCQDGDAPTVLVHADCGTRLELAARCPACEASVSPSGIRSRSRFGAPQRGSARPGGACAAAAADAPMGPESVRAANSGLTDRITNRSLR
ncbi:winged helix-turn-helix transcriptional regulator [Candidatus Poriferisodalis sp.]|uniref:winged helix-turn-helix transcriptional regulator n=1 Tax=Candidatus Poriferisodalis sp. TaxID=3101277 RepID=UPI003B01BAC1